MGKIQKRINIKRRFAVIFTFVFIFSIFVVAAESEGKRAREEDQRVLMGEIQVITAQVNRLINQSIRNVMGVIAYIKVNPSLTQEELETFANNLLPNEDSVISHFSVLKDTTIIQAYPLEGNEAAIGVDLSKIEAQRDAILQVKNEGKHLLTGPVNLVQGGRGLINRMPIYLDAKDSDSAYWGQVSLVIKYDKMLELSGLENFSDKYNVIIESLGADGNVEGVIYSNYEGAIQDEVNTIIEIPNGLWKISAGYNADYSHVTVIYYMLYSLGLFFACISAFSVNLILRSNSLLNVLVEERTHNLVEMNAKLEESIEALKETQDQLIMREKLAALGELVASVAHEINTPLGICVTVSSYTTQQIEAVYKKFNDNTLKKSDLKLALEESRESMVVLTQNLYRATDLVASFKMVATDQYLDEYRKINLREYIEEVLLSIKPKFKGTSHVIDLDIDEDIDIYTSPGAISQVLTNLLMNSLIHGFENMENGRINLKITKINHMIQMIYSDNGHGILPELHNKVFIPFFTTKKNRGSTGLGMHIIYNTVTHSLKGSVVLKDNIPRGILIEIEFPVSMEEALK